MLLPVKPCRSTVRRAGPRCRRHQRRWFEHGERNAGSEWKSGLHANPWRSRGASGWSEAQKRAYVLAENELALKAGWDDDLLKAELADLQGLDFDLDLIDRGGLTDPDEAPEPPAIPVSELGDVWLLGRHRLVCGDCTDPLVVEKALNGAKPHLMVTDPPYGVEYDPDWRGSARKPSGERLCIGVHAKGKVLNDKCANWREAWALFPGGVAYVWHAGLLASITGGGLEAGGFSLRSQIVWVASDKHFPGVGALQKARDMEERRLAGARSGDQRDRLSSPQAKIGAAQNFPATLRRKQRHESPAI